MLSRAALVARSSASIRYRPLVTVSNTGNQSDIFYISKPNLNLIYDIHRLLREAWPKTKPTSTVANIMWPIALHVIKPVSF